MAVVVTPRPSGSGTGSGGGQPAEAGLSPASVVGPFDAGHDCDPSVVACGLAVPVEDVVLQEPRRSTPSPHCPQRCRPGPSIRPGRDGVARRAASWSGTASPRRCDGGKVCPDEDMTSSGQPRSGCRAAPVLFRTSTEAGTGAALAIWSVQNDMRWVWCPICNRPAADRAMSSQRKD